MGLASKIKNTNNGPSITPQHPTPQQSFYDSGSAPVSAYPQPQQRTGSYDGRYGAAPSQYPQHVGQQRFGTAASQFGYPQHVGKDYMQPRPHGAPSSPPFSDAVPYEHPVQPHRQSHVESTPYGVQGKTPPYAGQGHISPLYGGQVQTPSSTCGAFSQVPRDAGAQPSHMQPAASIEMMAHKLQDIIQANGLQSFYDQGRFQATLRKVAYINFAEIAAQWKISIELAYDLAPLALYDIVFYCDDSGSMAFEENGERIDDLKFILSKVSGIATKFDDDGIVVRFMNSDVNGDGIRNAAEVADLISKVRFSGMTPLGTNLDRKVIQPFVIGQAMSEMAKPVLAIVITDGEPSGEDHGMIRRVIHHAKDALTRTRYGGGAFAVQIAQVGKDARTQKFLESLDKDPVVGGMIDCTSYYEMEEEEFARKGVTLTPELWLLKMCVGAIDPEYDSKDD